MLEQELCMTPSEIQALLRVAIPARRKVLITGSPALSKTANAVFVALELGYKPYKDPLVYKKPTDGTGIPWIDPKTRKATYHPAGVLAEILSATEPTLWLIEDIAHGKEAVQASFMSPLLDRLVNGIPLPECVSVMGTSNRATDKGSGAHTILNVLTSRFDTVVTMDVTDANRSKWIEDYSAYWNSSLLPPEPLAYLRWRPEAIYEYGGKQTECQACNKITPGSYSECPHCNSARTRETTVAKPSADGKNFPNLRTWESVGFWMRDKLPRSLYLKTFAGAVGIGRALEFDRFLKTLDALPDLENILANPVTAPIPSARDISALFAVTTGLASMSNRENFGRVLTYANRLYDKGMAQFGTLLVQDSTRRNKQLYATQDFIKMVGPKGTDLGKMLRDTSQA